MLKVTHAHLEQLKKALIISNKMLETTPFNGGPEELKNLEKTISKNKEAIEMLDNEYLDIKP